MRRVAAIIFTAITCVACTPEDRPPPAGSGPSQSGPVGGLGSGSGSGGSGAAGGNDGGGGAGGNASNCFTSLETLEAIFPSTSEVYGPHAVRGTISFPAGLPEGMTVGTSATVTLLFTVAGTVGTVSGSLVTDQLPPDLTEITYELIDIDAGTVTVGANVDMDGNNAIDIGQDWRGFYDGTVSTPVQAEFNARIVNVADCVDAVDFGVAVCNSLIECQ